MSNDSIIQLQFDFDTPPVQQTTVPEIIPPKKKSKRDEQKFVFEFMDMLTAPIITFTTLWADAIPQKLRENIQLSRLLAGMKREETATIPEVVAYMITRTFESPMHSEWVNIYTWCSMQYVTQWENREVPTDIAPEKLTDYEQGLLKELRNWIYKKRRETVKSRMKQITTKA